MTPQPADPAPVDAVPDLTLGECGDRWGVSSRNTIKARAAALGVSLRQDSPTRTVWPAEHLGLGDALDAHLKSGGSLKSYIGPSVTPPADGSDGAGLARPKPSRRASVTPPADGSDSLAILLRALPALQPDPLAVARGLADAAALGAWLSSKELATLLQLSPATVRGWQDGQRPRPGYRLERRNDHGLWWRVITDTTG